MIGPLYMCLVGETRATLSTNPTITRQGNVGPIFPNMPRTFPMQIGNPSNIVESLDTFR